MIRFCPNCHNLLGLELPATDDDVTKFFCHTCPYVDPINETIVEYVPLDKNPPTSAKKFIPGGCSDECMKEHAEKDRIYEQHLENERERRVKEEREKAYSKAFSLFLKDNGDFSKSEALRLEEATVVWQTMTEVEKQGWLDRVAASEKGKGKAPIKDVMNISSDDDED